MVSRLVDTDAGAAAAALTPGSVLTLGVRPEDVILGPPPADAKRRGVASPWSSRRATSGSSAWRSGDDAGAGMPVWKVRAAKHGPAAHLAVGDLVGLAVRPRGLRLFDAMTEERVL